MNEISESADAGLTLIELLISVAIMTLIVAVVVTATIVSLHAVSGRGQTVADSSGAQLLSSYLVPDAQSADSVNPTSSPCGASPLLELRWTDADGSTGVTDVVYAITDAGTVDSAGNHDYQLTRTVYNPSGGSCGAAVSQNVVAPNVSNDPAKTLAVCDTATCDDTAQQVGLQVTAFSNEPKSGNYTSYVFTVSGTRRTK